MLKGVRYMNQIEVVENNKQRIVFLDIARAFAILAVVLCHTVESIHLMKDIKYHMALSVQAKVLKTVMFAIGRLGVPIFLMLSGYLLLTRTYTTDESIRKFYRKNLLPLIITTEIWIILYNVFLNVYYRNTSIEINYLIRQMLFWEKVPFSNMWYMPMIIGVYIAIPYIAKIIQNFSLKSLKIPMLVTFILSFCLPTINLICIILKIEQFTNILDISFFGGTYGIYVIMGYYISQGLLKKAKTNSIWIVTIISFILACGIQLLCYNNSIVYNIWYNSPFIFICTINLFELFTRIDCKIVHNWFIKLCTYVSKIALAIFFLHVVILKLLTNYIKELKFLNPIKIILLFWLTFIVNIIIIYLLKKIKIIREKVLLIK